MQFPVIGQLLESLPDPGHQVPVRLVGRQVEAAAPLVGAVAGPQQRRVRHSLPGPPVEVDAGGVEEREGVHQPGVRTPGLAGTAQLVHPHLHAAASILHNSPLSQLRLRKLYYGVHFAHCSTVISCKRTGSCSSSLILRAGARRSCRTARSSTTSAPLFPPHPATHAVP